MIRRAAIAGDQVAVLLRAALQDERLSFRARGILASVLSRPIDWTTSAEKLATETPDLIDGRRGEGIKGIRNALNELVRFGYLTRTKVQGPDGRWRTDWDLTDSPPTLIPVDNFPVDNFGDDDVSAGHTDRPLRTVGQPTVGEPTVGRPSVGAAEVKQGSRDRVLETDLLPPSTGTSPGPTVQHGAAANHDDELRDGYPQHRYEINARAALGEVIHDAGLPLTVTEVLRFAYRVGAGDPWRGYLELKATLIAPYPGARDLAAVVRSELVKLHPIRRGGASA